MKDQRKILLSLEKGDFNAIMNVYIADIDDSFCVQTDWKLYPAGFLYPYYQFNETLLLHSFYNLERS